MNTHETCIHVYVFVHEDEGLYVYECKMLLFVSMLVSGCVGSRGEWRLLCGMHSWRLT